jgi:hypothetical protein
MIKMNAHHHSPIDLDVNTGNVGQSGPLLDRARTALDEICSMGKRQKNTEEKTEFHAVLWNVDNNQELVQRNFDSRVVIISSAHIIPDDGGSTHLWNVGRQLFYTAVHPRRQLWTSYSPPWELEISQKLKAFESKACISGCDNIYSLVSERQMYGCRKVCNHSILYWTMF